MIPRYALALDALKTAATRLPRASDERFVRLGRCQWSARKRRPVGRLSTLYRWLATMKTEAPEAWKVVNAAGVRVDGRGVRFKGKAVNGERLQTVLVPLLSEPAVAAYEKASAQAALERLEGLVVQPGPWGSRLVGCGLTVGDRSAELRHGRVRVSVVQPEKAMSVGGLCGGPDDLAIVGKWALSAPDLVVAALWALTASGRDSRPRAKQALAVVTKRIRGRVRTRELERKDAPYTGSELIAMGLEAEVVVLQSLIWPTAATVDMPGLGRRVAQLERFRRSPLRPRTGWALAE